MTTGTYLPGYTWERRFLCPFPKPRKKNTAGVLFLEAAAWRPRRQVIFYSLGQGRMKNTAPVPRWPRLYTEPPASSLLAAPSASESAGTSFGAFPSLPRPFSLGEDPHSSTPRFIPRPCPASLPSPGHKTSPEPHARPAGRQKGSQSRPLCPPAAARAAPAPALAQQGCVFFGSQRPPLLSISYGTPPGFKADSSGKAGEMDSVGSEGVCPLSFPSRVFLSPQEIPFSARVFKPPPLPSPAALACRQGHARRGMQGSERCQTCCERGAGDRRPAHLGGHQYSCASFSPASTLVSSYKSSLPPPSLSSPG